MAETTTTPGDGIHCVLEKGHSVSHTLGFPLHKCQGEGCWLCVAEGNKCGWQFYEIQFWADPNEPVVDWAVEWDKVHSQAGFYKSCIESWIAAIDDPKLTSYIKLLMDLRGAMSETLKKFEVKP